MHAAIRVLVFATVLGVTGLAMPSASAGDGCCRHHHRCDCGGSSGGSKSAARSDGGGARSVAAIPIVEVMPVAFMPMMSGRFVADDSRGTRESGASRLERLEDQVLALSKAVEELRETAAQQNKSLELIYQRMRSMPGYPMEPGN